MDKRECVIKTINHYDTDVTPFHLRFTQLQRKKLIKQSGIENFEKHFGNYIDVVRCMDFATETQKGMFKDEFGVVWDRRDGSDIGLPNENILKDTILDNFEFPNPVQIEIDEQMKVYNQNVWDTFRMVSVGFTLYERAWSLRGVENILMDMLLDQDFVAELFSKIVDYNIRAMEYAINVSEEFDAFYLGDDWGSQIGLIMGRKTWQKFIGPHIAKLIEYCKEQGKYVALHSCGNIIDVFSDLIDAGLDIYDTFQPEIYDLKGVKKRYGDKLSFLGGISTQTVLPNFTPEKVYSNVKNVISIMSLNGGFIAAPTHDVPNDVPVENIYAMIEAFRG